MYIFLGEVPVPVYGLMILAGVAAGCIISIYLIKRNYLCVDNFALLAVYVVLGGFLGAKFLYIWINRNYIQWDKMLTKSYFQSVMSGGFVFYGGLAGGLAGMFTAAKIHGIKVKRYIYTCIPALPVAHGFGRIGCGLAGCCYGAPYTGPFHIIYHEAAAAPLNVSLFPVQYMEALINFLLAAFLFLWIIKKGASFTGLKLYLLGYSSIRFFLEFLRYDRIERGIWQGLYTSQWISLGIFASVILSEIYNIGHIGKGGNI